jgi:hypothetical protein
MLEPPPTRGRAHEVLKSGNAAPNVAGIPVVLATV